jgi:cell division control protein 6
MFEERKIFKNEEVLFPDYLPQILLHRENEIRQLAQNLLPASEGRKPQNTFIFGPPGTGKTACIKFIFREFEDYSGIKTIYINCWDFKTTCAVFSKVILDCGFMVQRKGWAKDEILMRFVEVSKKLNKGLIICLDEADQLEQEVLYDFLRIGQYVNLPLGLVLISNSPYIFSNYEPRIRSSLDVEEIEFRPYSLNEMRDILMERAKAAFFSFDSAIVLLAANHAVKKGGDVRVGLQALFKAGKEAERENCERVEVRHMRKILSSVLKAKPQILEERISEIEKTILKVLGKNVLSINEIYEAYCKEAKEQISKKVFRDYLEHLSKIGLVKIRKRKVGRERLVSRIT